jgi:hypothetical protein
LTMITGHPACASTRPATEPITASRNEPRPWVP